MAGAKAVSLQEALYSKDQEFDDLRHDIHNAEFWLADPSTGGGNSVKFTLSGIRGVVALQLLDMAVSAQNTPYFERVLLKGGGGNGGYDVSH